MADEGGKEAYCPLFYIAHGGRFDERGRPIDVGVVAMLCTRPYDCFTCEYLQTNTAHIPDNEKMWVCSECVRDLASTMDIQIPGFFTEGWCQNPSCRRPYKRHGGDLSVQLNPEEEVQDRRSIFLQLVFGIFRR